MSDLLRARAAEATRRAGPGMRRAVHEAVARIRDARLTDEHPYREAARAVARLSDGAPVLALVHDWVDDARLGRVGHSLEGGVGWGPVQNTHVINRRLHDDPSRQPGRVNRLDRSALWPDANLAVQEVKDTVWAANRWSEQVRASLHDGDRFLGQVGLARYSRAGALSGDCQAGLTAVLPAVAELFWSEGVVARADASGLDLEAWVETGEEGPVLLAEGDGRVRAASGAAREAELDPLRRAIHALGPGRPERRAALGRLAWAAPLSHGGRTRWLIRPLPPTPGSDAALPPSLRRVVERVVRGEGDHEIAAALGLSPRTVRTYLERAFRRLGVRSRAELVRAADPHAGVDRPTGLPPALDRVARLLAEGLTDKEIAICLGLTHATVRTYVRRVYGALGVHARIELLRALRDPAAR